MNVVQDLKAGSPTAERRLYRRCHGGTAADQRFPPPRRPRCNRDRGRPQQRAPRRGSN